MVAISVYLLWHSYQAYSASTMQKIRHFENGFAEPFYIPNELMFANPELINTMLTETAQARGSNLFRTSTLYDEKGDMVISKYVYFVKETDFWEMLDGQEQMGAVNSFGTGYSVYIFPFQQLYESLPTYGYYSVELATPISLEMFLEDFAERLNQYFKEKGIDIGAPLSYADFISQTMMEVPIDLNQTVELWLFFMIVVLVILLMYYVVVRQKQISILKLNGLSGGLIWYQVVGRWIMTAFGMICISIVGVGLVISIFYGEMYFLFQVIYKQVLLCLAILVSSGLTCFVIAQTPAYKGLNNKSNKKTMLLINVCFKVCISVLALFVGSSAWLDYSEWNIKEEMFQKWEISGDYAMFYPLYTGDAQPKEIYQMDVRINQELYPVLNAMGSLFINARSYEPDSLLYDKVDVRYITVNPNYLKRFPLYDSANEQIIISEQNQDYLVAIPEQYKEEETKIRAFFQEEKEWRLDIDENVYGLSVSEYLKTTEITILWLKEGQSVFSFNPEVFLDNGNFIHDPIIRVITENNSLAVERELVLGGGVRDALKVKLQGGSFQDTYELLLPTLEKLELEHNLQHLIVVDELMTRQLADIRENVWRNVFVLFVLLMVILLLLVQNIFILFHSNKKIYAVQRVFGYSFGKINQKYFYYLILMSVVQIMASFLICKYFMYPLNLPIIFMVAITILSMELLLSILILYYLEKKSGQKLLQEGG